MFQPRPVVFDRRRLIPYKRPRSARSGVARDGLGKLACICGVLLELVFPIDLATKPVNVEFLGFLRAEDAQNLDGASEFHRPRVTLSLNCRSDLARLLEPSMSEDEDAAAAGRSRLSQKPRFVGSKSEAFLEFEPSAAPLFLARCRAGLDP